MKDRLFAAVAFAGILGGCAKDFHPKYSPSPTKGDLPALVSPTPSPTASMEITKNTLSDIAKYYPELANTKVENGGFNVGGINVDWYFAAPGKFNPDAVKSIYSFYQNLIPRGKNVEFTLSTDQDEQFKIEVGWRQDSNKKLFVVTPDVRWRGNVGTTASTHIDDDASISYLNEDLKSKVHLESRAIDMTDGLATEACQGLFVAGAQYEFEAYIGQEIFCNSLGEAITYRTAGYSYEDYVRTVQKDTRGFVFDKGVLYMKTLIFPKEQYNAMPTIPPLTGIE